MHWRVWGLVLVLLTAACGASEREYALERAPDVTTTTTAPTTTSTSTTSTTVAPTTTAAPTTTTPPTTVPPTTAAPSIVAASSVDPATLVPYHGFGAWLDRYDWSVEWAGPRGAPVGPEAVDHMAAEGVQTLYLQTSYWEDPAGVIEPARLQTFLDRARARGVRVIGWYLPAFVDVENDLRHVDAMAALGLDGIAIDIEGTQVKDIEERNRRLIAFSAELRRRYPSQAIGGIVLEPVLIEDLSATYWPDFPWKAIEAYYDVWMPMAYWTNRTGEWRSAHRYISTNIARVRERLGDPAALVHPIGGVGDKSTEQDLHEMVAAATEHASIGGSIYDYATSRPEFWSILRAFRTE